MDWPVLVLLGILAALAWVAFWRWLEGRQQSQAIGEPEEALVPGSGGRVRRPPAPRHSRTSSPPTGDPAHRFGPGAAPPGPDGSGPEGWSVKGNADSGLYHTPSSPSWKRMRAGVWFDSEEAAQAAGFERWDRRRSASRSS